MTLTSVPGEGALFTTTVKAAPVDSDVNLYNFYLMATDSQNLRWVQELDVTVLPGDGGGTQ